MPTNPDPTTVKPRTAADILEELLLADFLPESFEDAARLAIKNDRDPRQIETRGNAARAARHAAVMR